jgi:hypothetical protein
VGGSPEGGGVGLAKGARGRRRRLLCLEAGIEEPSAKVKLEMGDSKRWLTCY